MSEIIHLCHIFFTPSFPFPSPHCRAMEQEKHLASWPNKSNHLYQMYYLTLDLCYHLSLFLSILYFPFPPPPPLLHPRIHLQSQQKKKNKTKFIVQRLYFTLWFISFYYLLILLLHPLPRYSTPVPSFCQQQSVQIQETMSEAFYILPLSLFSPVPSQVCLSLSCWLFSLVAPLAFFISSTQFGLSSSSVFIMRMWRGRINFSLCSVLSITRFSIQLQ